MDLAALRKLNPGAGCRHRGRHISHCDRRADARRETARRHLADLGTLGIEHRRALAHRLAPLDHQADALAHRALLAFEHAALMAGETALLAPPLRQREAA